MQYPKTYNPFKWDNLTEWSKEELEYLQNNEFYWTEKVDGTNIRVYWNPSTESIDIRGKSDKADLHKDLVANIQALFTIEKLQDLHFYSEVIFYGEGYGPGIQKVGGNYRDDKSFIGFDIFVTSDSNVFGGYWLNLQDMYNIFESLSILAVPMVSDKWTLNEVIEFVKTKPNSYLGNRDFQMEGLIGVPKVQLFNRYGERVKVKVKCDMFK